MMPSRFSPCQALLETIREMVKKESDYASDPSIYQPQQQDDVDLECRAAMAEWALEIVKHCGGFACESVEVAMNLLDRALSTDTEFAMKIRRDRSAFQLACMTALYSTIKVREQRAIAPDTMAALSHGAYQAHEIEEMERNLLHVVHWRIAHPCTSAAIIQHLLELLFAHRDDHTAPCLGDLRGMKKAILDLCELQTNLAVVDYGVFGGIHPSAIAMAALRNALASLFIDQTECDAVLMPALVTNPNVTTSFQKYVSQVQKRLLKAIVRQEALEYEQDDESESLMECENDHVTDDDSVIGTSIPEDKHTHDQNGASAIVSPRSVHSDQRQHQQISSLRRPIAAAAS